jgi:zinc and cadmium transporter
MTLFWIISTCIIFGFVSFILAIIFANKVSTELTSHMVSLAIGTLLGAVFLEILPHALELSENYHNLMFAVLIGILSFFILEKLLIWRHCHGNHCEAHAVQDQISKNKKGSLILVGNLFHNFVDGILIASAFLVNINLGLVAALAILAHEIPQEMGNVSILLHSGYKKIQAVYFNLISSLATLTGAVLAYFVLDAFQQFIPYILAIAASSMLYISVSDLMPGLHEKTELSDSFLQVSLISVGVFIIFIIHSYLH